MKKPEAFIFPSARIHRSLPKQTERNPSKKKHRPRGQGRAGQGGDKNAYKNLKKNAMKKCKTNASYNFTLIYEANMLSIPDESEKAMCKCMVT